MIICVTAQITERLVQCTIIFLKKINLNRFKCFFRKSTTDGRMHRHRHRVLNDLKMGDIKNRWVTLKIDD